MKNKQLLIDALASRGYKLGCYNKDMELLSKRSLNRVIEAVEFGTGDIHVSINRSQYVIEISNVDREIDFNIIAVDAYKERYGEF